jgi:hypothetical protein
MQVRQSKWVGWWLAGVAAFIVILATPFLLESVAPNGHNWERLSSISQTYSAMSVLFSAAALLGVVGARTTCSIVSTATNFGSHCNFTSEARSPESIGHGHLQRGGRPKKQAATRDHWALLSLWTRCMQRLFRRVPGLHLRLSTHHRMPK